MGLFPYGIDADDVAWLKQEAVRLARETERAFRERDWLLTALGARMDRCPCVVRDCEQCLGNAALIQQVLR